MQVFQVVPPVVRDIGNGLEIDEDFAESLKIYMEHFESFSIACPVHRSEQLEGSGLQQCIPITDFPWGKDRLKFTPLPATYKLGEFIRALPAVRSFLREEIEASEYLLFSPYGLIGDWPTIALREAVKLGRLYTIESDVVHADLQRKRGISPVAWKQMIKERVLIPAFERSFRYGLSHAHQGIFQGQDVFKAYAPFTSVAHKLNHHVPVYPGDHIMASELEAKLDRVRSGAPLEIRYAGRAIDMKGPLEWAETLGLLAARNIPFRAKWLGDGPLLDDMKGRIAALGVPNVEFAGFVSDRKTVLDEIKQADLFLFCHNTKESARILGEALACGAPLVGFASAYPLDLVAEHGGGVFRDAGDVQGLANLLEGLHADRERLAKLVSDAARSGCEFDRHAALHQRARLVKQMRSSASLESR